MALTNEQAWSQAADEVARRTSPGAVGDGLQPAQLPADDVAYWDAVEKRAVELGGRRAGPSVG